MNNAMKQLFFVLFMVVCAYAQAQPKVVAHRGYWDVQGSAQNSITALEKAAEIACYGSEFDVIITRDGIPVIHHDDSIRHLRIEEHDYAEFRDDVLNNGEKLPTLKSYLKRGRQLLPMQLILEIKPHLTPETEDRAVDAVVQQVCHYGLQNQVEFISFSMHICERLHAQLPQCKVAYLNGDLSPRQVMEHGLTGIDYHFSVFTEKHPEWLDEAREVNCEVNVWTVNDAQMLEMFAADPRIDIITTNAPVLLQQIIARRPVSLASRIDSLLHQSDLLKTSTLGLMVYDATTNLTLYQRRAHKLHRPASTAKLFTAMAALQQLGPNFVLPTQVKYTGEIVTNRQKKRILQGDFYVIGGMDPSFTKNDLKQLAEQCARLGIDSIAGNVYADLSLKDTLRSGSGWCWDDTGDDSPILTPLLLDRDSLFIPRFVEQLREQKIGVQSTGYAVCPPDAQLTAFHSALLQGLLPQCLKTSDNLYAESILYQLGAQQHTPFAATEVSLAPVRQFITGLYPAFDRCNLVDGSGLSFYNMVTPASLVSVLQYAYRSPFYPLLKSALPQSATDGTLKKRMKDTPAAGRIFAKTGSITGTVTLAGYAQTADDHTLIFAIMLDGVPKGSTAQARELQDQLCTLFCQ